MPKTSKSCEKMRDFIKKYFHLNRPAVYNSSAKNINKIKTDIGNENWMTTICGNNCNEKFSSFHDRLKLIIDKHAPEKSIINKGLHPVEPWLTKGLIRCQKKQKVLYKKTLPVVTKNANSDDVAKYKQYKATLQ